MKKSLQLDPKHLKHFRRKRGLQLKQAAECLRKSDRQSATSLTSMYERIERTGITSPGTAERIAVMLDTTVAQLKGETESADLPGLWWCESSTSHGAGTVEAGQCALNSRFRFEAGNIAESLAGDPADLVAEVTLTLSECRIAIRQADATPGCGGMAPRCAWWSVRPATRNPAGIAWVHFTDLETELIRWLALDEACSLADSVEFNGNRIPAAGSQMAYELREIGVAKDQPGRHEVVETRFESIGPLIESIATRLRPTGNPHFHLSHDNESVTAAALSDTAYCVIRRVCLDEDRAELVRAPWRRDAIQSLETMLRNTLRERFPGCRFFKLDLASQTLVLE